MEKVLMTSFVVEIPIPSEDDALYLLSWLEAHGFRSARMIEHQLVSDDNGHSSMKRVRAMFKGDLEKARTKKVTDQITKKLKNYFPSYSGD